MPYARNKNIRVMISQQPGGPITFGLQQVAGSAPKNRVAFHNSHHPGVMVYFNIVDPDGTGLEFEPNPANAMWVAAPVGNGQIPPPCPPPNGAKWPGFIPLSVEVDANGRRTQLIAYYRNERTEKCRFALRFVDGAGNSVPYDPIGDGANGLRQ